MITYVVGDLLASDEIDIAHGCNTAGVMGAGIARAIASDYPEVLRTYETQVRGRMFVLGSVLPVIVRRFDGKMRTVWNLGTQQSPGPHGSLWGILLSFGNMLEQMVEWNIDRVGIPRIGSGIAGLKWADVERHIASAQNFVKAEHGRVPEVVVYTHPSEANKRWD